MVTDPIADLLTRIRNAQKAGHPAVTIAASHAKERILTVLQDEGYIERVDADKDAEGRAQLKVLLKYTTAGRPVIKDLRRISKPGRRVYVSKEEIPAVRGGLGVIVVSTSRGMLSDREARKQGVGGELICSVF